MPRQSGRDTRTADAISEELCEKFVNDMDETTLEQGLSLSEAARIAREIASAFQDRAASLAEEAELAEKPNA